MQTKPQRLISTLRSVQCELSAAMVQPTTRSKQMRKTRMAVAVSATVNRAREFSRDLAAIAADQFGTRAVYNAETSNNAASALDLIRALRAACNDAEYAESLLLTFGDGLRGKASKVRGTLADDLEAAAVNPRAIAHQVSMWRAVARSFATGIPESVTADATMRKIYDALPKDSAQGGRPKQDKAAPAPSALTAKDFEAWARENPALAFEVLERAMIARKETLKASALHSMRGDFVITK